MPLGGHRTSDNFCGDYKESFCFGVNLKFVFHGVTSFKIKQFQSLAMMLFNYDFSVYQLGTDPAAQQLVVWGLQGPSMGFDFA